MTEEGRIAARFGALLRSAAAADRSAEAYAGGPARRAWAAAGGARQTPAWGRLCGVALLRGVRVETTFAEGAYGASGRQGVASRRLIRVGYGPAWQMAGTLCHEVCHIVLGHHAQDDRPESDLEAECEAVACLVLQVVGAGLAAHRAHAAMYISQVTGGYGAAHLRRLRGRVLAGVAAVLAAYAETEGCPEDSLLAMRWAEDHAAAQGA